MSTTNDTGPSPNNQSSTGSSATSLDFDDEKVKERWDKIMKRHREELETDVLQISKPRRKLDPIAQKVLDVLCKGLIAGDKGTFTKVLNDSPTPEGLEGWVRALILKKGIASEVKKVTQRLNARRMTDGRRWVLSSTYVFLLGRLFTDKHDHIVKLMDDDLGVADKLMLDLESENGPLDVFADLIVEEVMKRNRIDRSAILRKLAAQRVRNGI